MPAERHIAGYAASVVSVLDRLKSPTPADISRKRQSTWGGVWPGHKARLIHLPLVNDSVEGTPPKRIEPSKRVQEFPNELLKISGGKLFFTGCQEKLGLKKSAILLEIRIAL